MTGLPEGFCRAFAKQFGEEELSLLEIALSSHLAPSIRLHPNKPFLHQLQKSVPWCGLGRYIEPQRGEVTFGADPLWHSGAYYVQEASSMILAQYIQQLHLSPKVAIDLCAAPGGKSTLLRSFLPQKTILVSNEIESKRSQILLENLTRYGLDETIVTSASPQQLRETGLQAELILVDAPCSGEGMFRKEPAAVAGWSEANVALCATRQREILDYAWAMLREGGHLIYSTCTYNREENEAQLDYLKRHYPLQPIKISLPNKWGVWERSEGVYSLMPHRVEGEGLTIFAVQKCHSTSPTPKPSLPKKPKEPIPPLLQTLFAHDSLYAHRNLWYHLSPDGQAVLAQLGEVKILSAGVALGEPKGKDFIPAHPWACSYTLSHKAPYTRVELSPEEALHYLKRESLTLKSEKGINILTYQGVPLGFAKQIGSRVNNLYPRELMIRNSQLTIDDIPNWNKPL